MTDAEFESIFREHKDAVYRFAWRMTGSPEAAEDIAQDVFVPCCVVPMPSTRLGDRSDPFF